MLFSLGLLLNYNDRKSKTKINGKKSNGAGTVLGSKVLTLIVKAGKYQDKAKNQRAKKKTE